LVLRAKLEIAAACHRFGKVPSHNVNRQVRNPQSAGEDATMAHQTLGYTRMWSIHPAQIEPIVAALQPRPKAVCEAIDVLNAAHIANWGPVSHDGKLHDRASFRQCFHLVQQVFLAPQLHPQAHPK
jgi:citrate lyase subunit beta/citryl-CoA lyase